MGGWNWHNTANGCLVFLIFPYCVIHCVCCFYVVSSTNFLKIYKNSANLTRISTFEYLFAPCVTCVLWYVFDISDPPLVRFVFAACLRLLSGRHTPRLIKSQWGPCTVHCSCPTLPPPWCCTLLALLCTIARAMLYNGQCTLAVHLRSSTITTITVGLAVH